MFDFFKFKKKHTYPTWADIPPIETVESTQPVRQDLPDPKEYPKMPSYVAPPRPNARPKPKQTEFYRIGCTLDGMTSLTLLLDDSMSATITLTKKDAKQMIRMIQATFIEESPSNE